MASSCFGRDGSPPPPYSDVLVNDSEKKGETSPLLPRAGSGSANKGKSTGRGCGNLCVVVLVVLSVLAALTMFGIAIFTTVKGVTEAKPPPSYSIAIIGAGPAGIAAAQQLLRSPPGQAGRFNITIFESKPVVGGALAFHNSQGSPVYPRDDQMQIPISAEDLTGTALLWSNSLFTRDSERLLGDRVTFTKVGSEKVGYYQGTHKVVTLRRPYNQFPFFEWLGILWNYGASAWRAESLMQGGAKIREALLKVPLGTDAESILESIGVLEYVQTSSGTWLRGAGISDHYTTDIFDPQVRRLFAQGARQVSGLALRLAAAQENEANRYIGGNMIERLQRMVEEMDVHVRTSTRISAVKHVEVAQDKYQWLMKCEDHGDNKINNESDGSDEPPFHFEAFDKLIVAAQDRRLRFETSDGQMRRLITDYGMDEEYGEIEELLSVIDKNGDGGNAEAEGAGPWPRDFPFIPAHVAFFTSEKKLLEDGDDQVLFRDEENGKRELALVREIYVYQDDGYTKTEYLYRALSQAPILDDLLARYPITWSYQTRIENGFALSRPLSNMPWFNSPWADDLWWTSVIQYAWNGVDMNWLAGKMVAAELADKVMSDDFS